MLFDENMIDSYYKHHEVRARSPLSHALPAGALGGITGPCKFPEARLPAACAVLM